MQELTVFEHGGKLLTDSREVALMVEMNHFDLIRKIKGYIKHLNESNFTVVEFYIESTYIDSKGEERPCYLCTKKGCDMIANKMTGKKGVIFTAKYTTAFEKMKNFIEKGSTYHGFSLKEQVESLEAVSAMLHMNDASKLLMLENFYKEYNIPAGFLPKYEHNGNRQLKSLSALLEENHCGISAVKLNKILLNNGYLEERERVSTKGNGVRSFKALTDKGLTYGENVVSPHNQREVQPLYYSDTFMELFNSVNI